MIKKIASIVLKAVVGIFLAYAVFFSLVGTAAILYAYSSVQKPINQVKRLVHENPTETTYMADLRHELKRKGGTDTLSHRFVPLDSISKSLVNAVVASEDDGFWVHPGFDINAIAAAFERNRISGKIEFGGSTLTQQLAKNLFLNSNRSFGRKFQELGYALLMEKYLGKKRIMELYLNYAQWGPRIFGCEAASRFYFHKASKNLSVREAARLAATLAHPSTNPGNEKSAFLGKRVQVIADNLYTKYLIDDSGYIALAGKEPPRKDSAQADDEDGVDAAPVQQQPSTPPDEPVRRRWRTRDDAQ